MSDLMNTVCAYYRSVNFDERNPFDPARWAEFLDPDYTYVDPSGTYYLGKEEALRAVTESFSQLKELRNAWRLIQQKSVGESAFYLLLRFTIIAAPHQGEPVDIHSSVRLALRVHEDGYLITDETAVIRKELRSDLVGPSQILTFASIW